LNGNGLLQGPAASRIPLNQKIEIGTFDPVCVLLSPILFLAKIYQEVDCFKLGSLNELLRLNVLKKFLLPSKK
jgi:hypothetical protein